jgi:glycosyltransferase 2 family protein
MTDKVAKRSFSAAPIAILVGAGALLYFAAISWSGSSEMLEVARRLGIGTVVVGTVAASCAYLIRFFRWYRLLAWLGHRLPLLFNLRVYLSGLALTSTPGKLGETFRSALLLSRGVGLPHSLAAFFADRLSDVIGVALLGVLAGWVAAQRQPLLELLALTVIIGSLGVRVLIRSPWWPATLERMNRTGRIGRVLAALALPASAWTYVWSVPRLAFCASCAVLAYGLQALVFAAYLHAAGTPLPPAHAVTIFSSATLIGAASMVPAGLGAMEAALVFQLLDAGVPRGSAVAATIATRASTLWFGMLLGSLMLVTFPRASARAPAPSTGEAETP